MNLSEIICQVCGQVIEEETAVKVTGEGWVCSECCEQWRTGNDVH